MVLISERHAQVYVVFAFVACKRIYLTLLCLELIYHEGNTLMWNVEGSRVYRVEIKLPAGFVLDSSAKEPLNSVTVSCTCPDAFKRKTARQRLCKHANSCFLTLVDSTAEEHLQKAKRQQIAQEVKETTLALSQFEEERLQEEKRISQVFF